MIFKDDPELHSDKGVELYHTFHGVSEFCEGDCSIQKPVHIGTIKNHELLYLANERMRKRFAEKSIYTRDVYYSLNRCDGTGQLKSIGYGPLVYDIRWHYDGDYARDTLIDHLIRLTKVKFASPRVIATGYYPERSFNHFHLQIENYKQKADMKYVINELLASMDIKEHAKENPCYPEGIVVERIKLMNEGRHMCQFPIVYIKKIIHTA